MGKKLTDVCMPLNYDIVLLLYCLRDAAVKPIYNELRRTYILSSIYTVIRYIKTGPTTNFEARARRLSQGRPTHLCGSR